jgi:flagellar biosynthesis regulator FlbT
MYTEIRLTSAGKFPCLEFNVPLLTWNEWMQDNISVMPAFGENTFEIILFSFHSGTVLARCQADSEQIRKLFSSPCIALAAISIGDKPLLETTIFKCEPFDLSGHFFAGIYLQTSGDNQKATDEYQAALLRQPNLFRTRNLLGLCFRQQGNNEEAEKQYLASIEANADSPEAMSNLGTLYRKTGRDEKALEMFNKALQIDEYYLNALLNMSKIYLRKGDVLDSNFFEINLKLFKLFFNFSKALQRLSETAELGRMTLSEYCQRLGSSTSFLNSDVIISQMRSIENYINNGAMFGAISGLRRLLKQAEQTFHANEITEWCKLRLQKVRLKSEKLKFLELSNQLSSFIAEFPALKESSSSPLGKLEFFSLVILEIMRDGQIDLHEKQIVSQLKELLEINSTDYHQIINRIRSQVTANPFFEKEPKGFQPQRLFRSLVKAASRDRIIEESERKILIFASKAFGLAPEEVNRIVAEVTE